MGCSATWTSMHNLIEMLRVACRSKRAGRLWCLLLCVGLPGAAFARYSVISWTTENGLPNNWITAIHQTRDGYIWLTTMDGVARFDGVHFRVFNRVNTPGITTNWFTYRALWEDRQGNLWLGTQDGGLIRDHDGVFTALTTKDGLPSNKIIRIDGDASGVVWIFTSAGVVRWRDGRLALPRSRSDRSLDAWLGIPKNWSPDARFFGLWRFAGGQWQRFAYGHWSPLPMPPGVQDPTDARVAAITEDAGRRLWFSLDGRPHEYYCVSRGHLKVLHGLPNVSFALTYICAQDREGRIWMGNHYGAVGLWRDGRFHHLPGIATPNPFQVMEDREGNLWIATLDSGLYRLRKQVITTYRLPGRVQQANVIGPMLQDRSGAVWLGSVGVTRFKDGRFMTFYRPGTSHSQWRWANEVDALCEGSDGSLWVHTWDGIILRLKHGRFHEEKTLSAAVKGRLNVIFRDHAGNIWFGGEQGLYRLHDGALTHFTVRNGLPGNVVNVIEEGRNGKVWLGGSAGLAQYVSGRLVPVVGIQGVCVEALYEDHAHVWWVGTRDDGLYRLAAGSNGLKITHFTTVDGLYSNNADQVLEDNLDYLWISCDSGLFRVHKQLLNDFAAGRVNQVICTHLGASDGMPEQYTGGGQALAFKARDGRLWFATLQGVAVVDPQAVAVSQTPPRVRIEGCLVDLHPVPCYPGLRLRPGHTNLEITYTALSFIHPGQIRFNYKLQGLDRHWTEAGSRRTAYLSHLPSGRYVFKVIAATSDGVWNIRGKSLAIVVLPPFYSTWWFFMLGALLAAGAVILAWQYRVAQLKRANAAQEAFSRQLIESQEQERQRIAAGLHDSLGQTMLIIKNRANLALKTLHDTASAQEQLDEISASASDAIEEVRTIAHNLRPYRLDRFGLTKTLQAMCTQAARTSGIVFSTELEPIDGLFAKQAEINIYRVVQEAVNNIIKHSGAGEARFTIRRLGEAAELKIEDNGRGFVRSASDGEPVRGGFGLLGIAERVRLMGGTCVVDSSPGHGARLTIRLTCSKNGHES